MLQGVAPLAGAWIEILMESSTFKSPASLPLRERGLKSGEGRYKLGYGCSVAPLAGAWIEIY